jgi:hypothetical protein
VVLLKISEILSELLSEMCSKFFLNVRTKFQPKCSQRSSEILSENCFERNFSLFEISFRRIILKNQFGNVSEDFQRPSEHVSENTARTLFHPVVQILLKN